MKLMHLADLHLDSPFVGVSKDMQAVQERLIQAPYQAFERACSTAIQRQVDVVVISGDIYDSQAQTIYAQHAFRQQLERLSQADIPVVMIHGNHDYLRPDRQQIPYPDKVHLLGGKDEAIDSVLLTFPSGETARFYGFSYHHRWIEERKVRDFPKADRQADYTIGLLHGSLEGESSDAGRYAPFTVNELLEKNYDYWALGHIHQGGELNQEASLHYAGTTQGRHRNETGEKGGYIVELSPNTPLTKEFIAFAPIIWQEARLTCLEEMTGAELASQLQALLNNYEEEAKAGRRSYILTIYLDHAERLEEGLQEQIQAGELMEALQFNISEEYFVAVGKIIMNHELKGRFFEYDKNLESTFYETVAALEEGEAYNQVMDSLWTHPVIRSRLRDMTEDVDLKEGIIEGAQNLLIQTLGFQHDEEGGQSDED